MPTHWTYADVSPDLDLAQGDILGRDDELLQVLHEVHPWFCDSKYKGFLVATQTCDLVLRDFACRTPHISLVPFQPLTRILPRLAADACEGFLGFLATESEKKLRELLERILNQNEQSLGLLYLHTDVEAGIHEHSVAQLRVCISLKASHYEILRKSRVGRLDHMFAAKMGWLSGNLYSRVATRDWSEVATDAKTSRDLVDTMVGLAGTWVNKAVILTAKKNKEKYGDLPPEEMIARASADAQKPAKERGVAAATQVAEKLIESLQASLKGKLRKNLGAFRETLAKEIQDRDQDQDFDEAKIVEQIVSRMNSLFMATLSEEFQLAASRARPRFEADQSLKNCFKDT